MNYVLLGCLGLAVGLISSFFGIGGGSLIVPVLYTLYNGISPAIVIPISLGSIFIVVALNLLKFSKLKLLPPKNIIFNFVIFCSLGAYLGAQVVYLIDNKMAKFSMGIILILMVLKLIFLKQNNNDDEDYIPNNIAFAFTGLLGSFISSITGLGGGIIFTPFFMNILKVPTKKVSPYSNLAMFITTFIGVLPHLFNEIPTKLQFGIPAIDRFFIGHVNFAFITLIAIFATFTSSIGVKLNGKVNNKLKKRLLAFLLTIFAIKLLIN